MGEPLPAEILEESRKKIACLADWIIPGHGQPFPTDPAYKARFNC